MRIVCNFSCGAASAVATKLSIAKYAGAHEVVVHNAFLAEEHPDEPSVECGASCEYGEAAIEYGDLA